MSAAPQTSLPIAAPPPPPARGVGFIDLDTAARRSGLSVGQLKRLCLTAWGPAGLAEKRKDGPGKATWRVREDADPRLARVKFPEQIFADLSKVPQRKRDQAIARKQTLDDLDEHVADAARLGVDRTVAVKSFAEDRGVAVRTLQLWIKAWKVEGLAGLIDGRGREAAPWADHPFFEEVKRLYLLPRRLSKQTCYEMAMERAAERGWPTAHYRTCLRVLAQIPQGVVDKFRYGETAYTNDAEPYIERDYSQLQSNEIWNADHHRFDVTCVGADGKFCRPWLTAFQDFRSRKIVGWSIFEHDPNTDTIVDALVKAIRACGKPAAVHVDNGKDFDSYELHGRTKKERRRRVRVDLDASRIGGLFTALEIKAHNVQVFHGQSKPIERFFGTLEDRFGKTWTTYCGNKPENRPEDHPDRLAAGEAPTVAELADAFAAWLENDYHQRPHAGDAMDGKSPDQVFAENFHRAKVVVPAALLDELALPLGRPLKVGQNGVQWQGLLYGKHEPGLIPYQGKEVRLRVLPDLSAVRVYTPAGVFVCEARANQKLPPNADRQMLRAALNEKRRHNRLIAEYRDAAPRMTDDLPQRLLRAAVARRKQEGGGAKPPTPTTNVRPFRSPLEDQLEAVRNTRKPLAMRLAAGGERDVPAPPRRSLLDASEDFDLDVPSPRTGLSILSLAARLGDE